MSHRKSKCLPNVVRTPFQFISLRSVRVPSNALLTWMTNLVSYAMGNDSPDYLPSQFGGVVWEVADLPSEPKLLLDVMERILAWTELYLNKRIEKHVQNHPVS